MVGLLDFRKNNEKQKGRKRRRTEVPNFEAVQRLCAYVSSLFVFHDFPEIQQSNHIFAVPIYGCSRGSQRSSQFVANEFVAAAKLGLDQ